MKTELVVKNPDATMPLRVSLHVECNTSTEEILSNVLENSKRIKNWVKLSEPHDRVAVICGSGPSLADTLDEAKAISGEIFALNGAAQFLADRGIEADFQVIMDAQPATAHLIGPAKAHLFASQVNPHCFTVQPDAMLWHATHGDMAVDEQEGFPQHDGDYCLVGGAVSVGNTAIVLLYAMGYRTIHMFGMDSSHKDGCGHAFRQPMNDGDPCTIVEFGGKEYVCSLTMRLQAEHFSKRARELESAGCKIHVHGYGLLPDMWNAPAMAECDKYEAMWARPEYREVAPGEEVADTFVKLAKITKDDIVIDFGCGTGRGAKRIHDLTGCDMLLLDFTSNSLDESIKGGDWYTFLRRDLTGDPGMQSKFGFCTDVMEHISPEQVDAVIQNVMNASERVFFQISLIDDVCGALIGQHLHLSVHPFGWWLNKFRELGYSVEWSQDDRVSACYFVAR